MTRLATIIQQMKGINMAQIGFVRYTEWPCNSILLKTLFTVVFWITMRQHFYEKEIKQQSSTLAHLAAPIQVSVNAATSDLDAPKDHKSKPFHRLAKMLKHLLLQLWIWVVVITLFLCGAYGQRMTAFRIIYMALFLVFLISFQVSCLELILEFLLISYHDLYYYCYFYFVYWTIRKLI